LAEKYLMKETFMFLWSWKKGRSINARNASFGIQRNPGQKNARPGVRSIKAAISRSPIMR